MISYAAFIGSAVFVISMAIVGGVISRWHGGGFEAKTAKFWRSLVWAVPFSFIGDKGFLWSAFIQLTCALGKSTGAGNAIDHGTQPEGKPERLEFLIRWLKPKLSELEYELALNVIVGFAAVSGAVVCLSFTGHGALAVVVAVGGMLRALAYDIAWIMFPQGIKGSTNYGEPTEVAEFITGAAAYTGLAIALIVLIFV